MTSKSKGTKEYVASFRIPQAVLDEINERIKTHPVKDVRSANQFMRKLVMDYLHERLCFKNADHYKNSTEENDAEDDIEASLAAKLAAKFTRRSPVAARSAA